MSIRNKSPKTSRPRLFEVVERHRLFAALDEAIKRPCVWIYGPPGAGKTSFAASWLESREVEDLWYQVDEGDSDASSFFYYIRDAAPKDATALPLLTPEYLPEGPAFARRWFRLLCSQFEGNALVVLDNYQLVPSDALLHQLLAAAIDELPDNVRLIVISREPPPVQFAHHLVNKQMARIEWDALRMTEAETAEIAGHHGVADSQLIRTLHRRSDGWAAGLTLMLERCKQGSVSETDLISATRQDLFAYFAGQLLMELPKEQVGLLAQTALFPNFTLALAEQLTKNHTVGMLVEQLYSRQLFTSRRQIPARENTLQGLGDQVVYEYHALFREFLRGELTSRFNPQQRGELMIEAAELLQAAGNNAAAFALYLTAREWDKAAHCTKLDAASLSAQSRWKTLLDQIHALPEELVGRDFWLLYWKGMALLAFDPSSARRALMAAHQLVAESDDAICKVLASAGVIWTYSIEGIIAPEMSQWVPVLEQFLNLEGRIPPPIEFVAQAGFHTAAMWIRPDHPRLNDSAMRLLELMDVELDPNQRLIVATSLLHYFALTGNLDLGRILIEKVDHVSRPPSVSPIHYANWICARENILGGITPNSVREESLLHAIDIATEHSLSPPLILATAFLSMFRTVRHDLDGAGVLIRKLAEVHAPHRFIEAGLYHTAACMYEQARGHLDLAARHARSAFNAASAIGGTLFRIMWGSLAAAVLVESGERELPNEIFNEVKRLRHGTPYRTYDALIELAEGRLALLVGDRHSAHAHLNAAFQLMQDDRCQAIYTRLMVALLPQMLAEALRAGIQTGYVVEFVERFHVKPPRHAPSAWPWPIRIRTLGSFRVEVDGREISFSTKAPKRLLLLLKELVSNGGRDVDTGALIDQLWTDSEGDKAVQAFTNALHRLRNLLQYPEAVTLLESRVTLEDRWCWVDIWALENVADAMSGRDMDSASLRVHAAQMIDAYRGPFLHMEQSSFAAARRKYHAMFLRIAVDLGTRMQGAQFGGEAVEFWERCLERDAAHEPFYLGLLKSLTSMGRVDEARAVYARAKTALTVNGKQPSRAMDLALASLS